MLGFAFAFGLCFGLIITAEVGFRVLDWSGCFGLVVLLHDQVGIERELGSPSPVLRLKSGIFLRFV